MLEHHLPIFERLCAERDVVVVTGGTIEHIRAQVTPHFDSRYYALAQSGNHCVLKDGSPLWYEPLSPVQETEILTCIEQLKKHFAAKVRDESDLVEKRGAQISYSVIGYHAPIEEKYAFDPGDIRRQAALAAHPENVAALARAGVEVCPAGTSGYNFIPAGKHKGFNVQRFYEHMQWQKDDCIYIGDALFPGGNDETVVGVIPTHAVKNPDDTFAFITQTIG